MSDSVKKVLGIMYRVYSIFCMCMTAVLIIAVIIFLINFGKITALITEALGLQLFL